MKRSITILLILFLCTIGIFSQSEKILDPIIDENVVDHTETITVSPVTFGGSLLTEGILETTFPDYSGNVHPMGIAFDDTFYYVVGGGGSPSGDIAKLDSNFNLITTENVPLDCRSIFYNPADDNVYIKSFTANGLYRLRTNPFNGGYDGVFAYFFQNEESKVCLSADGLFLYDHFNGDVRIYELATGDTVDTITLDIQHNFDWPRGNLIVHTGTYLLTFADNVIYAYDPSNGNFISACTLTSMPASNEWSVSYTNGMFFLTEDTETTWYAWTIDDGAVSVEENDINPFEFSLEQNYPNPFNPSTKIRYSIPQSSNVIVKVFDFLGNEIKTLVNEQKNTGTYEITWYADNLPSGIYFYKLIAGSFVETKKMLLLK
jgi:hypothetical protein